MGEMRAQLAVLAPGVPVIELFADVPSYQTGAGSFLLAAYNRSFPNDSVFVCVVDPGVGDETRRPVVLKTGAHWYVGPENGLLDVVARNESVAAYWEILWRPTQLSDSFHGRDLFAPVAARIANGDMLTGGDFKQRDYPLAMADIARESYEIIYIDHFGNLVTGICADDFSADNIVKLNGQVVVYARTFSSVPKGECFWYKNASGLIEIAVSQGDARQRLKAGVGDVISLLA